jgi:hypothetical protein
MYPTVIAALVVFAVFEAALALEVGRLLKRRSQKPASFEPEYVPRHVRLFDEA